MPRLRHRYHRKHLIETSLRIPSLIGGINVSKQPDELEINESPSGSNSYIDPDTSRLRTRPGIQHLYTAASVDTVRAVEVLESGGNTYVYRVSGGNLYYNVYGGSATPTTVGALNQDGETVLEPFLVAADTTPKLLISDGGGPLQYTEAGGASVTAINGTGSPDTVVGVATAHGRIIAIGDSSQPQRVFIGTPGSVATDTFDSSGSDGEYIDLGAEPFAVIRWDKDLVIFTKNPRGIYRLNISDPSTSNWTVTQYEGAKNITAVNAKSILALPGSLNILDFDGFKTLVWTEEYSDVDVKLTGIPVNGGMSISSSSAAMWHNPKLRCIMLKPTSSVIWLYHYQHNAWTKWDLLTAVAGTSTLDLTCAAYVPSFGKVVYGSNDGWIMYEVLEDPTDNHRGSESQTTENTYTTHFVTKEIIPESPEEPKDGMNIWLLKRVALRCEVLHGTQSYYTIRVYKNDRADSVDFSGKSTSNNPALLYSATGDLNDATDDLNDAVFEEFVYRNRKVRARNFQFEFFTTAGESFAWHRLDARFALVGRA